MTYALNYIIIIVTALAAAQASEAPKRDEVWDSTRQQMLQWSQQLQVTCVHCHDAKNYKDSSMKTFKIAKDHSEIVELLNRDHKNKIPKVDCYMCHRGKAIPDYKEKIQNF